jgi:L-threonylcarbamoyladenylate synthase
MIEESTRLEIQSNIGIKIRVSGSLQNHYSPVAQVFLDQIPKAGQGFLALDMFETPPGVIRLASPKTNSEFAQVLYSSLRAADTLRLTEVVVLQPEGFGITIAIRDRLLRAAT